MDAMTTVYLCRHGETESARDNRYYSDEHAILTATGALQSTSLARHLAGEPVSAVYVSPADRARATADEIASRHGTPLDIVPEFAEWDPGDWSGLTRSEVRTRYPRDYDAWLADPAARRPPNGESLYDVAARCLPAFCEIVEAHEGECIVVVGHNTLNRVLVAHMLCVPLRLARGLICQNTGGVNKITRKVDEGWQVIALNEPANTGGSGDDSMTRSVLTPVEFSHRMKGVQSQLKSIWPEGRNDCTANDGQHWTLPPFERPVSVGRVEACFLYNLAATFVPRIVVEVGTGFGYSSLWLAGGSTLHNSGSIVYSIDNRSEGGIGHEGLRFARSAACEIGVGRGVRLVHGQSPDVLSALGISQLDLAFIDGNHHGAQPRRDFVALAALMGPAGIVIWHDVESRYAVPAAFNEALTEGWDGCVFPTSCRIGVTYRDSTCRKGIDNAFAAACALRLMDANTI